VTQAFRIPPASLEPVEATPRGPVTLSKEVAILRRFVRCAGCGKPMSLRSEYDYDHIIALDLGGPDTAENMQPLCEECLAKKNALDAKLIAKSRRLRGVTCTETRHKIPGSKGTGIRKPINGPAYRVDEDRT
jgi:hypothetical protein